MEAVQSFCSSAWYGGWSIGGLLPRSLRAVYLRFFGTVHATSITPSLLLSKKHVVVLAHGASSYPELWGPLVDELKLTDAVIIAPQFVTQGPNAFAIATKRMSEVLQTIPEDTRVTWVGHSWGGILGAHLVANEKAHIDRLIMISSRCAVDNVRYNVWHGFLRDRGVVGNAQSIVRQIEQAKWPDTTEIFRAYDPYDWLVPEDGFKIAHNSVEQTFEGCGHLGTLFSSSKTVATWITQ